MFDRSVFTCRLGVIAIAVFDQVLAVRLLFVMYPIYSGIRTVQSGLSSVAIFPSSLALSLLQAVFAWRQLFMSLQTYF